MSERTPGDVIDIFRYVTEPESVLDDRDDLEDFADEVYQFCGGTRLPANPTKDDIRQYAVLLMTAYGGWLINDWDDGGCSVYFVLKKELTGKE